jgi:hypothetical protein
MKKIKLIACLILGTSLLFACNKEEHWETSITEISNITAYSAEITLDYDFGNKTSKTFVGVDLGIDPDLKSGFERFVQETKTNESITSMPSQLYANQTYYVRSFMAGKKDTIWSEIMSFTTLEEHPIPCSISSGEVYYNKYEITELVGALVEVEDPSSPELYTYEVAAGIGNLTCKFAYEPIPGYYETANKIVRSYQVPNVIIGCGITDGGSNCNYEAKYLQSVHVTRDINDNVSISFCDLEMIKTDEGSCFDTLAISGRLKN